MMSPALATHGGGGPNLLLAAAVLNQQLARTASRLGDQRVGRWVPLKHAAPPIVWLVSCYQQQVNQASARNAILLNCRRCPCCVVSGKSMTDVICGSMSICTGPDHSCVAIRSHSRIAAAMIKSSRAAICFFEFHTCCKMHTVATLVRTFDSLHNDCHGGKCNTPFTW